MSISSYQSDSTNEPDRVAQETPVPSAMFDGPQQEALYAALGRIGVALASTLDPDELLDAICRESLNLFHADGAYCWLRQGDDLVGIAAQGVGREFFLQMRISLGDPNTLGARVAREGQPRFINHTPNSEYVHPALLPYIPARSILGVPLRKGEQILGALVMVDTHNPARFSPHDVEAASLLGAQAAIALENARLVRALKTSEDQYRTLVERSLVGVYLIQDGRFKFINPRMAEIFGYEHEELLKLPVLDVVTPDDRPMVAENLRRRIEGEVDTINYELRGVRKDGRVIELEALGNRLIYEGRPAVQGTLRDITDRKRVEAEIKRLKEFNEQIVQGLDEGILLESANGTITFANPKMAAMLGYEATELLGMHWTALVPPQEQERVRAEWARRTYGVRSQYETRLLPRQGQPVPVIVNATPLFEDGRYRGVLSAFTDISQRQWTENTLHALNAAAVTMQTTRDPEAVYHAAAQELAKLGMFAVLSRLEEAPEYLTIRSLYGEPEPIRQLEQALGFSLTGHSFPIASSPQTLAVIREQRPLFTGDIEPLLLQILADVVGQDIVDRAAEVLLPGMSAIIAPLAASGQVLGTLMVISPLLTTNDLPAVTAFANQVGVALQNAQLYQTLRERAELLRQAYTDLKELDRFREEVVQNVSHDLRTPLTFIQGYVDLLLSGAMGPLSDEQQNALQVILDRSHQLHHLANDIISPEKARLTHLALRPVALAEVARTALRGAEVVGEESGLTFALDAPHDLPTVQGDKQRLVQVFDNLLSNAIKYSPHGGKVTVHLREVADGVRAAVIDQGIGIAPEQLERIWQRFYQVDGGAAGAGIGLNIVRRIIEAHGGTVGVESAPGQGSTFYFTLPRAPAP